MTSLNITNPTKPVNYFFHISHIQKKDLEYFLSPFFSISIYCYRFQEELGYGPVLALNQPFQI